MMSIPAASKLPAQSDRVLSALPGKARRLAMRPALRLTLSVLCMLALSLVFSGCGSSTTAKATAGAISITNGAGTAVTVSTLPVGSTLHFSMTPVGDSSNEGVDWTVTCKGNSVTGSTSSGSCGTLTPAHTAAGAASVYTAPSVTPIDGYVTITATVSSNPAQSKSISLTVTAKSVGISFISTSPSSLAVNGTFGFAATVVNDPAYSGVYWLVTCGSTNCGSFNPVTTNSSYSSTYTAPSVVPAGGTVTVTATSLTDTTKSVSSIVQITNGTVPVPVTIAVTPSTLNAQTSGTAHTVTLSALVGNDSTNAGVDWTVSCWSTNCGGISSHTASGAAASYIAPSSVPTGGTVTITAKSTTNSAISATATVNIVTATPIVVTISNAPSASTTEGAQAALAATVANDTNNLGVDWTVSCGSAGACGTLTPTHTASGATTTYTAPSAIPSGAVVTILASSSATTAANPAVAYTTITAQPPAVSITQTPSSRMISLTQATVSATVANDVNSDGVDWSATCGSTVAGGCGWFVPAHTASGVSAVYTAPPVSTTGTSVTIVATSTANSSKSASSASIAINPQTTLSVGFVPALPAKVLTGATVNLNAAVANDSTQAGVDWQVCGTGCGFFTIKPAVAEIPATSTTSYVPASAAVTATTVSGWPNGLPIPYTAPAVEPDSGSVVVKVLAHADGTKANAGTMAISASTAMASLSGLVQAGSQAVAGSTVALYAAGTSGYASAATQVASTTTDASGNFTLPAGFGCPSSSNQMYLVATGGTVGSNTANPQLGMMTALGSCAALPSSVVVNELTTVASAWAVAPFSGLDFLYGKSSYLYLGASSSNATGLANAFAMVNNLVDISTGKVRYVTPAGNAAVPFAELNTLADALNACTASSGGTAGDGSSCGTLLTATNMGSGYPQGILPADSLQAAFNQAQHPNSNSTGLYSLATSGSPFQPVLSSNPSNWSVLLNYSSGGGLTSTSTLGSFALDGSGNLWMADSANNRAIEWNSTGASISPSSGFAVGGGLLAIDVSGNVWVSGNGVLTELTTLGDTVQGSPYLGVSGGGSDLTFDPNGNLWIAEGGGLYEFSSIGKELSPSTGFTNTGITDITSLGFDNKNNLWIGSLLSNGNHEFSELTWPGAQLVVTSLGAWNSAMLPVPVADNSGYLWIIGPDRVCKLSYSGTGLLSPGDSSCTSDDLSNTPGAQEQLGGYLPYMNARALALDGSDRLWIVSQGGPEGASTRSGNLISYPLTETSAYWWFSLDSSVLSGGVKSAAVDGSGNMWVLLANNTVAEYVGIATPTITPAALVLKNSKQGSKP
jgi:hypothetical protein